MAENFLGKKIGPFTGGVWVIVVVGGVGLALLIKRGIGGGDKQGQPILIETVPLRKSGGATSDNDIPPRSDPGIPPKQEPPKPIPPKLPVPVPKSPPTLPSCPQGMRYDARQKKCVPLAGYDPFPPSLPAPKQPAPTPTPTPTPTPQPRAPATGAPGGFSTGCDGIGYFPSDYAARKNMSTAKFSERSVKLAWAFFNLGYGPQGIFALSAWLQSPSSWGVANGIRRSRGLRAMTAAEWGSAAADIKATADRLLGKENRLSNADIMALWERYNTPFVCVVGATHRGARDTRHTGVA